MAAGVAKAHADVVLISGYDGGTGASPLTSLNRLTDSSRMVVAAHLWRETITVVLAAGAWSGSLARAAGLDYEALVQKILSLGQSYRPAWKGDD